MLYTEQQLVVHVVRNYKKNKRIKRCYQFVTRYPMKCTKNNFGVKKPSFTVPIQFVRAAPP